MLEIGSWVGASPVTWAMAIQGNNQHSG